MSPSRSEERERLPIADVFVGMGVAYYCGARAYAGTISRVSADRTMIWIRQDRAVHHSRRPGVAFIFVMGAGHDEIGFRLQGGGGYAPPWGDRPLDLGVRRWHALDAKEPSNPA